jgi:hypothetical protein
MELTNKQSKYLRKKIRGMIGTLKTIQQILNQESTEFQHTVFVPNVPPPSLPESPSSLVTDELLQVTESQRPTTDESSPLQNPTPSAQPLRFRGQDELESSIAEGRLKRLAIESEKKSSNTTGWISSVPVILKQGHSESST